MADSPHHDQSPDRILPTHIMRQYVKFKKNLQRNLDYYSYNATVENVVNTLHGHKWQISGNDNRRSSCRFITIKY